MSGSWKLPALPDNQRWKVYPDILGCICIKRQERRWWGWRTIAWTSGRPDEFYACIDQVMRPEYYARVYAEHKARQRRERASIPWGTTRGGDR